jgi:L-aminopeptidase/D-esterase-like protein
VASAQPKGRARDLGVPFDGDPGPLNAITDVSGVLVGHTTLIWDRGAKAVRTGVTTLLPRGRQFSGRVPAGWFTLNGNGEMTGTTWLNESGLLEGPVLITNTHSVGVVRDAVVRWGTKNFPDTDTFSLPVVAETWDGLLNDINGFHVAQEHVFQALESAGSGPVAEGNVGGGTGMVAFQFKGGIGTSSRIVSGGGGRYVIGVLVQANFGRREQLRIAGVPVGREIPDLMPSRPKDKDGSIIVVVATDAPLLPHQLRRLATRVALGLGRDGSIATNSSGDIFIAFSTAIPRAGEKGLEVWSALPNDRLDGLFAATVQATEESVVNAMVAAETMTGYKDTTVYALPHDRLREILKKYNRLSGP